MWSRHLLCHLQEKRFLLLQLFHFRKMFQITGIKRDVLQKGLVQFGNLIGNQTFLTIFLHTLEAQKTLSLKDLSNIASLLVIALHNRMDFLMEAIKSLLQENIQKYVDQGCPQLLLRRYVLQVFSYHLRFVAKRSRSLQPSSQVWNTNLITSLID